VSASDVWIDAVDVGFSSSGSPDPYILGAEKCGVKPERCLVVEDAPNGIRSGNAAGCKTLGLLTTHSPEQVAKASPDYTVKNLSR
jgi:glycerol 3-phosphatase-1